MSLQAGLITVTGWGVGYAAAFQKRDSIISEQCPIREKTDVVILEYMSGETAYTTL